MSDWTLFMVWGAIIIKKHAANAQFNNFGFCLKINFIKNKYPEIYKIINKKFIYNEINIMKNNIV